MNKATFIKEVEVLDPDTTEFIKLSVYKHQGGGMFAIDSSFLDQCTEDDENARIPDVFHQNRLVELID